MSLLAWLFPPAEFPRPLPRQERIERCLRHGASIGSVAPDVFGWCHEDGSGRTTILHAIDETPEAVILELDAMAYDPFPSGERLEWVTRRAAARLLGFGESDDDGRYWRIRNRLS